jgi:hypothetical protein
MSDTSYFLWHPRLRQGGGVVAVVLTRGQRTRAPESGRAFFEALLEKCGIEQELTAWGIHEFVTAYFTRHDTTAPERRSWEECWEVLLLVDTPVKSSSLARLVGAPLHVAPETENEAHRTIPVRVIADFRTKESAKVCVAKLRAHAQASETWQPRVFERYQEQTLSSDTHQVWIDLISANRSDVAQAFDQGRLVMELCEKMGGGVSTAWPSQT